MAITPGEIIFLDTNILLAATDEARPEHHTILAFFAHAENLGIHPALSGQVIREYLVVATRPLEQNGFGLTTKDALVNIKNFRQHTICYDESEAVSNKLIALAEQHRLKGKRIHDANIAATMAVHNITQLLTLNAKDFRPFKILELITLKDIKTLLNSL